MSSVKNAWPNYNHYFVQYDGTKLFNLFTFSFELYLLNFKLRVNWSAKKLHPTRSHIKDHKVIQGHLWLRFVIAQTAVGCSWPHECQFRWKCQCFTGIVPFLSLPLSFLFCLCFLISFWLDWTRKIMIKFW